MGVENIIIIATSKQMWAWNLIMSAENTIIIATSKQFWW